VNIKKKTCLQVKVMLRVSDSLPEGDKNYLSIDKKKRQVTLSEPTAAAATPNAQDRGPMVSAPKMFAFDALHTSEDSQVKAESQSFRCSSRGI